ncbi:hypothetical protein TSUD_195380 [Trifolium subterraneum]|nr:hypothetical protein TSUD_195380 [Trifolium subterraneum]
MLVWDDVQHNSFAIIARDTSTLEECNKAHGGDSEVNINILASNMTQWSKPSSGFLKCNIDASFPAHHNVIGINLYLRNEDGALTISAKRRLLITMASCS